MEVALIRIDPDKKCDDGRPKIVASTVVDTNLKTAVKAKPDRDDLLALTRAKFFRYFPGRRFVSTALCRDSVLNEWKFSIFSINESVATVSKDAARFTVMTNTDVKKALKTLAKKHHKTLSKLAEHIIVNWVNQVNGDEIQNIQIDDAKRYAYTVGRVARIERELTGKFDPDKYLIDSPKEKVKAVKAYAKTELADETFQEKFDILKGVNLNQSIPIGNYGYFMAGFYGFDIESVG